MIEKFKNLPLRKGVGIVLLNSENKEKKLNKELSIKFVNISNPQYIFSIKNLCLFFL